MNVILTLFVLLVVVLVSGLAGWLWRKNKRASFVLVLVVGLGFSVCFGGTYLLWRPFTLLTIEPWDDVVIDIRYQPQRSDWGQAILGVGGLTYHIESKMGTFTGRLTGPSFDVRSDVDIDYEVLDANTLRITEILRTHKSWIVRRINTFGFIVICPEGEWRGQPK